MQQQSTQYPTALEDDSSNAKKPLRKETTVGYGMGKRRFIPPCVIFPVS